MSCRSCRLCYAPMDFCLNGAVCDNQKPSPLQQHWHHSDMSCHDNARRQACFFLARLVRYLCACRGRRRFRCGRLVLAFPFSFLWFGFLPFFFVLRFYLAKVQFLLLLFLLLFFSSLLLFLVVISASSVPSPSASSSWR